MRIKTLNALRKEHNRLRRELHERQFNPYRTLPKFADSWERVDNRMRSRMQEIEKQIVEVALGD